ncbi:MAG: UDP-N-acetylmuramate--L-alanine ligase [Candidatus Sungbacteria bacterium]|nr:UDP-N-acetylmuramate--L-alanine ligase [Candidatus Sungbacteria bacterium]
MIVSPNIHFVGIGGIGVSALAKYYLAMGATVSGSDLVSSEITEDLARQGVEIKIGRHKKNNVPKNTTAVVSSPAISEKNAEVKEAHARGILVQTYPEALGELTRTYQTATISGSHGKSTTTALVSLVLEEGYFDPTVIIGVKLREFGGSNFRRGRGPYLVIEADEWNRSFLNYSPEHAVVTNIDREHVDTYKTLHELEETFTEYLAKVPPKGVIVANADDPTLAKVSRKFGDKVRWYSLRDPEAVLIKPILKIPGEHNLSNALAAFKLGRALGVFEHDILRGLSRFSGAWRRFELRGVINGAFVIADYGHHPSEIKATIQAARDRFPLRRIWCIFQPHQHQRLQFLWDDFVTAFDQADRISFLPVYDVAGRETAAAKKQVNSLKLAGEIEKRSKDVSYFDSFDDAKKAIRVEAHPGDIILLMGAGDIYDLTKELTEI